jgi:hypothetical protein
MNDKLKKCLFSEIPIGCEFTEYQETTIILFKVDEEHYSVVGQTRLWKADKNKEYFKL